ncbi:MAG TPA: MFS transporter [Bryobacteraceae bacterium]|nr:MFS transporter [Bryobacteraceae bacterium]
MNRYLVVIALALLSWITYVDRAAISSVKDPIAAELGLDDKAMGAVFSAFALGYAIAQIPAGWAADRFGPRLLLAVVVTIWSLLTGLTGIVTSFTALLAVRFLFGLAEAGAYPGTARAFYSWLPPSEHGRANGIVFAASRIGAALAFPIMAWFLETRSWRGTFYLLAIPGILWAGVWYMFFRDRKAGISQVSAAGPAMRLSNALRTLPFQLAALQYFAANFTTFLCLSWMNPYLKQRFSLSVADAAFYTMTPLLVGASAQWISGYTVDRLFASRFRSSSRALPAIVGFLISAAGAIAIPFAPDAFSATLFFSLAAFGAEVTISPSWAFCIDLGGKNAGSISGAMNTAGNFGSFVSANVFPWLQAAFGSAGPYFMLVCAMNVLSALAWTRMRRPEDTGALSPRDAKA